MPSSTLIDPGLSTWGEHHPILDSGELSHPCRVCMGQSTHDRPKFGVAFDSYVVRAEPGRVSYTWMCWECYFTRCQSCEDCGLPFWKTWDQSAHGPLSPGRFCFDCLTPYGWFVCDAGCGVMIGDNVSTSDGYSICEGCVESCGYCDYCEMSYLHECGSCDGQRGGQSFPHSMCMVHTVASRQDSDACPFGVEIEVEFDYDDQPQGLGDYHDYTEAPPPYLQGWRGEYDGSLNSGAEFISPPLVGAEGVAEVLAMFGIVREQGGKVPASTGQHIHCDRSGYNPWKVQAVAVGLEDLFLASCGSFARYSNGYAQRIKGDTYTLSDWVQNANRQGMRIMGGRCTATETEYGTIEFRHPPGTLISTQFVINLGLSQLAMRLSKELSEGELRGVCLGHAMNLSGNTNGLEAMRQSVAAGLALIQDKGWRKGGDWSGVPYDLQEGGSATVSDNRRGRVIEVVLPTETEVVTRFQRQLKAFFARAGVRFGQSEHGRDVGEELAGSFA